MRILGINQGHNGAAAYVVNGKLEFYIEEERLSRSKYDGNPFRGMIKAIERGVDILAIGGTSPENPRLPWTGEDPYSALVRKFNPKVRVINFGAEHHLGHAASAFYNSGFETAAAVIVDGAGSQVQIKTSDEDNLPAPQGYETETIFNCSYPANFDVKWKSLAGNYGSTISAEDVFFKVDDTVTITKAYEAVSHYLGFGFIEAGKTMGLAPFGQEDENIPDLFISDRGDKNMLIPQFPAGAFIDETRNPYLRRNEDPTSWHQDPSRVTEQAKNLAWKVQKETQELVGDLIEKAANITGEKNIVVAGGYGLNCVANYYLQKRFPDLNIYFEPVAHDGGTAIGIAKLIHHSESEDTTIRKQESLYTGVTIPDYNTIDPSIETKDATASDIAQLIADRNIVSIFQGRSEAGPRALGNRSIMYDPTDPNGKDIVNQVKGREWFRPFAGSMLAEKFEDWFETKGLKDSPFMMYAIDFKMEKHGEVPAITHVDGTCRIQTVTPEQNSHYYEVIKEFEKITGVPIIFNTSFNLAGEPLVETIEDAIHTLKNSDINYLYLPEISKLLTISREIVEE